MLRSNRTLERVIALLPTRGKIFPLVGILALKGNENGIWELVRK